MKYIQADSVTYAEKLYSQQENVCKYFRVILTYKFNQVLY